MNYEDKKALRRIILMFLFLALVHIIGSIK